MFKTFVRRFFQTLAGLAFSLMIVLAIGVMVAMKYPAEAKGFIETRVNSWLYWHYADRPDEVRKHGKYCAYDKCFAVTMEYAWYGAPSISFSKWQEDDWTPRLQNGVGQRAWRIREVKAVGVNDGPSQHLDLDLFMVWTAAETYEYGSTDPYAPKKGEISRDARIVLVKDGYDWPFDSFAVDCPSVMVGFRPQQCREPAQQWDAKFSFIPPKL